MTRQVKNGKVAFKGGQCGRMDHHVWQVAISVSFATCYVRVTPAGLWIDRRHAAVSGPANNKPCTENIKALCAMLRRRICLLDREVADAVAPTKPIVDDIGGHSLVFRTSWGTARPPHTNVFDALKSKKVAHTRLPNVGFRSWSRLLAVSLQAAGDVSHKPGGRLPLLSARPAFTPATFKRAATNFAAWWTEAQWVWTVCQLLPDSVDRDCDLNPGLLRLSPAR